MTPTRTGLLAIWWRWSIGRGSVPSWLLQAEGKWVIVLTFMVRMVWMVCRTPHLCASSEARKLGHDHDHSSCYYRVWYLKWTKPEAWRQVSLCHRKIWLWVVKSLASMMEMRLWNLFEFIIYLNTFLFYFFPLLFPPSFSLFHFFFPTFFSPLHIQASFEFFRPSIPSSNLPSLLPFPPPFSLIFITHLMPLSFFFPFFLFLSLFKMNLWSQGHSFFIILKPTHWWLAILIPIYQLKVMYFSSQLNIFIIVKCLFLSQEF